MTDMTAEQAIKALKIVEGITILIDGHGAGDWGEPLIDHYDEEIELIRQALSAPRVPDVDELARTLMAAWQKAEPDHPVSKHPVSFVATFADMARAVIPLLTAAQSPAGDDDGH